MPDSNTQLLGLIGDPVAHSLSPILQGFLIGRRGLNYCYLGFHVPAERLAGALAGMLALGIKGLNVTIPHKEEVLQYLDRISPEVEAIGAANVVVNEGGRLVGYNSDAFGFIEPLHARRIKLCDLPAVVMGAGGAAAAAAYALVSAGAQVAIANRTLTRARCLAARLSPAGPVTAHLLAELPVLLPQAGLLVNATPVGMYPHHEGIPLRPELLHEGLLVYDLVYNPATTRLLSEGTARGARTVSGLETLVWQGIKALELWTGHGFGEQDVAAALAHVEVMIHG